MGQDGYPRTFTNLSVPSVIFAADEDGASWYGSLRGGVELGGDADGRFSTTGSRWGIKGSTEVSEGLSAVYLFETRVGSGAAASQGTNQLYAGLSGGFGSLTLGKFHNAAYNGAGSIRDQGWWYSSGDAATKIGNTVSYAFSSDAANFQVDAIMDSAKDSGRAIDEVQFGVSVNLGEIGKVGLGYENVEDWTETKTVTTYALKSGKVTSDFVGDAPTYQTGVSGGIDAELEFDIKSTYKRSTVALGECVTSAGDGVNIGSRGQGRTTMAECLADDGGTTEGDPTNQWAPHPTITTPDTSSPWGRTDKVAGKGSGINLPSDYDIDDLMSVVRAAADGEADMPVMRKVVMVFDDNILGATTVTQTQVDGIDLAEKITDGKSAFVDDARCVDSNANGYMPGHCASRLIFYTVDDDGNEVPATPDHIVSVKLLDESSTAGSQTVTDERTIDSSVDDLTVEANPAGEETTPMDGYKATHVSVQLNLGAMTLGLGYSEKESNKMGSMDQKTTFVGASGSIGDTGMGWRAWTRDISNVDNAAGDANPWGIGINKDLGGGAFTFVEHHDADGGASGNTIIALGVNF